MLHEVQLSNWFLLTNDGKAGLLFSFIRDTCFDRKLSDLQTGSFNSTTTERNITGEENLQGLQDLDS